jgi:hypothetical protein
VGAFRTRNLAAPAGFERLMKWIFPLLAVALLAAMVISGCGGDGSGSTVQSPAGSGASAQTTKAREPAAGSPGPRPRTRADDPECPVDEYGPCGEEPLFIVPQPSGH